MLMKFESLPEFQQSKFPFKPNAIDNILPDEKTLKAVETSLGNLVYSLNLLSVHCNSKSNNIFGFS